MPMASNYLERIAFVGSRTAGDARPAVVGQPDMPRSAGFAKPPVLASRAVFPDQIEDPSPPQLDHATPPQIGLEPVASAVEATPNSATKPAPGRALPEAGSALGGGDAATTGPRDGAPRQAVGPQTPPSSIGHLQPETSFVVRAPRGLRSATERSSTAIAHSATRRPLSDVTDGLPARHEIGTAAPRRNAATVAARREWRPLVAPRLPARTEPPMALPVDAAAPKGNTEPAAARERARPDEPLQLVSAAAHRSRPVNPSEQTAPTPPTRRVLSPEPQQLSAMPRNPATNAESGNRITIGRVEVQVNNRAPRQPIMPRSERRRVSWSGPGLLDRHYLDRFFLRP